MRPDVGKAMGLKDGRVGYHLRLRLAEAAALPEVIAGLKVVAAPDGEPKGKPFRISAKIRPAATA